MRVTPSFVPAAARLFGPSAVLSQPPLQPPAPTPVTAGPSASPASARGLRSRRRRAPSTPTSAAAAMTAFGAVPPPAQRPRLESIEAQQISPSQKALSGAWFPAMPPPVLPPAGPLQMEIDTNNPDFYVVRHTGLTPESSPVASPVGSPARAPLTPPRLAIAPPGQHLPAHPFSLMGPSAAPIRAIVGPPRVSTSAPVAQAAIEALTGMPLEQFNLLPDELAYDIVLRLLAEGHPDAAYQLCRVDRRFFGLCQSRIDPRRFGITAYPQQRPPRRRSAVPNPAEGPPAISRDVRATMRRTMLGQLGPNPVSENPTAIQVALYSVGYHNVLKCPLWAILLAAQATLPNYVSRVNRITQGRRERIAANMDDNRVSSNDLLLWVTSRSVETMNPLARTIVLGRYPPYFWGAMDALLYTPHEQTPLFGMVPYLYLDPSILENNLVLMPPWDWQGRAPGAPDYPPGYTDWVPPFVTRIGHTQLDTGGLPTWLPADYLQRQREGHHAAVLEPIATLNIYAQAIALFNDALANTSYADSGCVNSLFDQLDVRLYAQPTVKRVAYFVAVRWRREDVSPVGVNYWF